MERAGQSITAAALLALALAPAPAHAQRTAENAVTASDDAFGTQVGLESTGIYSESDARGFSPLKAGNYRFDGIYIDPVAIVTPRLKASTAIRVGHAAIDFPFPAPTGVVDAKVKVLSGDWSASPAFTFAQHGGWVIEFDTQIPIDGNRFGLIAGYAGARNEFSDGSRNIAHGVTVKPVLRLGGVEFSPFAALGRGHGTLARPLTTINGDYIPPVPAARQYLGQNWAEGKGQNDNMGATLKAALGKALSLRSGVFLSRSLRIRGFSELYAVSGEAAPARHRFIADPRQEVRSWSGEAMLAWRLGGGGALQHRLFAGYRFRDRRTQSGGSAFRDFGEVTFGVPDPEPQESFTFNPVNNGRVKQSALMLGYAGTLEGVGRINLGVQKANYRATFRDAATGAETLSRARPWLYNANLALDLSRDLSLFAGTQTGLEDSGAAPENAQNRNEQLRAARATQYEAGMRWHFGKSHLVLSAFQITKPYFGFDGSAPGTLKPFIGLGRVRHRGVEVSLAGHFGERLHLLAGAVLMQPRVIDPPIDIGLVGSRPAGTPSIYARIDINYRTGILGGLTPVAAFAYSGKRAVGAPPEPGRAQPMLDPHPVLDLGLRHRFKLGQVPASFRFMLSNVFDDAAWKVLAANTLQMDDRRRITLTLSADF
jgi:iron complex outermembrane recepter protein